MVLWEIAYPFLVPSLQVLRHYRSSVGASSILDDRLKFLCANMGPRITRCSFWGKRQRFGHGDLEMGIMCARTQEAHAAVEHREKGIGICVP